MTTFINIAKYSILTPLMIVWLYIIGHVIIGFWIPLIWHVLREIFNV